MHQWVLRSASFGLQSSPRRNEDADLLILLMLIVILRLIILLLIIALALVILPVAKRRRPLAVVVADGAVDVSKLSSNNLDNYSCEQFGSFSIFMSFAVNRCLFSIAAEKQRRRLAVV